jgi:hypothetical protein
MQFRPMSETNRQWPLQPFASVPSDFEICGVATFYSASYSIFVLPRRFSVFISTLLLPIWKEMTGSNNKTNGSHAPLELWRHPDSRSTQMWDFKEKINKKYGLDLESYDDLYLWSIENISDFWAETWYFTGIKASKPFDIVGDTFHMVTQNCTVKYLRLS